jgi:hypothetical protein
MFALVRSCPETAIARAFVDEIAVAHLARIVEDFNLLGTGASTQRHAPRS